MKKIVLLAVLASLGLGACAPKVRSVPMVFGTPKDMTRPPESVVLYVGDIPACAYREVAFIEANAWGTMPESIELMRKEAASYGANGLILTHDDYTSGLAVALSRTVCASRQRPMGIGGGAPPAVSPNAGP